MVVLPDLTKRGTRSVSGFVSPVYVTNMQTQYLFTAGLLDKLSKV